MNSVHVMKQLKKYQPSIIGQESFRTSSVLIPLIEKQHETHVLFEVRSMHLTTQPGDVCFPGGRQDKNDKSALHCAVRETTEELGIKQSNIHDIVPLGCLMSSLNTIIYPFVGRISNEEEIIPNKAEVADIFTVPLSYFLKTAPMKHPVKLKVVPDKDFPFDLISGGKNYKWSAPKMNELFYQYEDRVIWGLTARIINHLVNLLQYKGNA